MKGIMSICSFLASVLGIYSFIIFVRIIVSWLMMFSNRGGWRVQNSYNDRNEESVLQKVDSILGKICDPYLNLFKGVKFLRRSTVDFTPILALVLLNLAKSILRMMAQTGRLTVWTILAIVIEGLWGSLFSFVLLIIVVLLFVRYFIGRKNSYSSDNTINTLDQILEGPVEKVYKLFYKGKQVSDQKLVLTSAIFYLVLMIGIGIVVSLIVNFLIGL